MTFTEADWVDQMIYGVDLTYGDKVRTGIEMIAEYFIMENEDATGKSYTTTFWYVQAGKTFFDLVMPYVRYESFEDMDTTDPYFLTLGTIEYSLALIGARFNIDLTTGATTAIKIEVGFKNEQDIINAGPKISSEEYAIQWTFGF